MKTENEKISNLQKTSLLFSGVDNDIGSEPDCHRSIKSFACRGSKLSPSLEKVWERTWPHFGLNQNFIQGPQIQGFQIQGPQIHGCQQKPQKREGTREVTKITELITDFIDPAQIFKRESQKILEIGFGNGRSLAQMAAQSPKKDFIGIEVYKQGIAELLNLIEKMQLSNIRIFWGDAAYLLNSIKDDSLDGIQIYFSDPWPKNRHHKRRLIQRNFVAQIASKLKNSGYFHLATDWKDYANHMMSVISNNTKFRNVAGHTQFSSRPDYRPITKYEQRGIHLGHPSWDLIFERQL